MNAADDCGPALDSALNSLARRFDHVGRHRQMEFSVAGFGHNRLRDDVLGRLVERGRNAKKFGRRHLASRSY